MADKLLMEEYLSKYDGIEEEQEEARKKAEIERADMTTEDKPLETDNEEGTDSDQLVRATVEQVTAAQTQELFAQGRAAGMSDSDLAAAYARVKTSGGTVLEFSNEIAKGVNISKAAQVRRVEDDLLNRYGMGESVDMAKLKAILDSRGTAYPPGFFFGKGK